MRNDWNFLIFLLISIELKKMYFNIANEKYYNYISFKTYYGEMKVADFRSNWKLDCGN